LTNKAPAPNMRAGEDRLILDSINQPSDLRGLTFQQLEQLAAEIRGRIIDVVSANGGHLASSLGAVELTLAIHRVFQSPQDKIVWDVGHQAYAHKLLTGRRERFHTLRLQGGLSGFPAREESPHDAFGTGHASTSISAALGIAVARDIAGERYNVIAVTGDGALTGGISFEALNQAGHLRTRLIVILNDNGMAIAPCVGALSRLFSRLRINRRYYRAEQEASQMVARMPLGSKLWRLWGMAMKGVKGLIIPSLFWDELGFTYIGPIDGHDIAKLEAALAQARDYARKPVLVHAVTTKGKGYSSAEDNAEGFHGVSPTPGKAVGAPSYSQVFGKALLRLAREDPKIVAITAAMPEGTGLNLFADEIPQRFFDVGICEQHAVTFAAGLAAQGFTPVVAVYSTFLQRALDQVIHDVCIQNLPVIFAIDRGGIVGEDGRTHQGTFDLSYLSFIPNLVLAAPGDENELQHLLYTAVQAKCPFAIRYPRGSGTGAPLDENYREIPLGQAEVVRDGTDIGILAVGVSVAPALEAAGRLAQKGIECAVVNARFIKPLDSSLIEVLARRTKRLVTVEENATKGGFGDAVAELVESSRIPDVRMKRIGLSDIFVEHGPSNALRAQHGLDAAGIEKGILSFFTDLIPLTEMKK